MSIIVVENLLNSSHSLWLTTTWRILQLYYTSSHNLASFDYKKRPTSAIASNPNDLTHATTITMEAMVMCDPGVANLLLDDPQCVKAASCCTRFYETFYFSHIIMATFYLGLLFWHAGDSLDTWVYLWATLAI